MTLTRKPFLFSIEWCIGVSMAVGILIFLVDDKFKNPDYSTDPHNQTPPSKLSEQCSPTLNLGSFDSPLKALHKDARRPSNIRGQDTLPESRLAKSLKQ